MNSMLSMTMPRAAPRSSPRSWARSWAAAPPPHRLQRACSCGGNAGGSTCTACEPESKLQRRGGGHAGGAPPPSVARTLASPGKPLAPDTRAGMERRFGYDFSRIRIHDGGGAAASARDVSARAYTVGGDIVFGAGEYRPGTPRADHLLAHELVHTIQQGASTPLAGSVTVAPPDQGAGGTASAAPVMQAKLIIGAADDPFEREADRIAAQVMSAAPAGMNGPRSSFSDGAPGRRATAFVQSAVRR